MYICLCKSVTDHKIKEAVSQGCCTYKEVRIKTGIANQCGKCACYAKKLIRDLIKNK